MSLSNAHLPLRHAPLQVRTISLTQPLRWLMLAWRDFLNAPQIGLIHGIGAAVFAAGLIYFARDRFWWLVGAFSASLLVAPILSSGLYAVSRKLEREDTMGMRTTWRLWLSFDQRLVSFGALLALAGGGWMFTSASLITLLSPQPVNTPADFLHHVVLNSQSWLFEIWLMAGGLLAAPVFASVAVALPLLVDQRITVLAAVLTSWRAVLANPVPLALWAAVVTGLMLVGFATLMLGLIVVVPLIGHARWHAYRDLVVTEAGQ